MNREYPRPQLKRDNWINLNGTWDFEFDNEEKGFIEKWYESHEYKNKIVVPFCYQSKLSTINDSSICDRVWYHKKFTINKTDERVIIHFGAVDYEAHCFINKKLAYTHTGGSTSFSFDITDFLVDGEQDLVVMVYDPSLDSTISRGKQTWKKDPFECFYVRTTGIWQTVWLEYVHESAIKELKITPNIDEKIINLEIVSYDQSQKTAEVSIYYKKQLICKKEFDLKKWNSLVIDIPEPIKLWSPEKPNLYDLKISIIKDGLIVDKVDSYFGMRKISIKKNKILLNNKPYYLRLILDQGYYPDGLLSYPTESDLENDIILAKQMGFNGARVKYAIHPVAGRMPGHMNVLLAEAEVDYDDLYDMESINPDFKNADLTIVVGANDVLNPAARNMEGTPIYGMPILNVDECPQVLIFNYDLKPGYSGVPNPLYEKSHVTLVLGNAAETIAEILEKL